MGGGGRGVWQGTRDQPHPLWTAQVFPWALQPRVCQRFPGVWHQWPENGYPQEGGGAGWHGRWSWSLPDLPLPTRYGCTDTSDCTQPADCDAWRRTARHNRKGATTKKGNNEQKELQGTTTEIYHVVNSKFFVKIHSMSYISLQCFSHVKDHNKSHVLESCS